MVWLYHSIYEGVEWGYSRCSHMQEEPDKEQLLQILEISTDDISSWEDELRKYVMLAMDALKGER